VYDALTASGLANGQPFPSINAMDKPATNAGGSNDIYFGPGSPSDGRNWLRTVPDKGFFVILRLYGPTEAFFNQTWRPGDLEAIKCRCASECHAGLAEMCFNTGSQRREGFRKMAGERPAGQSAMVDRLRSQRT